MASAAPGLQMVRNIWKSCLVEPSAKNHTYGSQRTPMLVHPVPSIFVATMRSLNVSATYTVPEPSKEMPRGK